MRDAVETAYHTAEGRCLDAMHALRRFDGAGAIEELKAAIRSIEHARRLAAERHRREARLTTAFVAAPQAPPPGLIDF